VESEGLQRGETQEANSNSHTDTNRSPEETATLHRTVKSQYVSTVATR